MSVVEFSRQFDDLGRSLGACETMDTRKAAFERFNRMGLPNKRLEEWHYTDLSVLADKGFDLVAPAPDAQLADAARALLDGQPPKGGAARYVFVDGHYSEALSVSTELKGIRISTQSPAPALGELDSALAALNVAFAGGGAVLQVAGKASEPVELVFVGTGRRHAPQVRLRIALAPGAEATVIQHFVDLDSAEDAWLNLVLDVEQDSRSRLHLYRLQSHGPGSYQTTLNRVRLAEEASFVAGNVEIGGHLTRNEFEIALAGERAEAKVYGIAVTRDRTHCDTRIVIDHRAPHTTSRQDYRAIVADASRSVFNGKVIVQQDAQHIDAQQRNDNLLLSAKAEVDTKPELEIYADQVACGHGATVGELDEDHLFYLRSRGIDAESAKSILATAFADTILNRIALDELRDLAREAVRMRLPSQLAQGPAAP